MGTRADFYVGRGAGAKWIGSIAFDGHPYRIPESIRRAATAAEFRRAVGRLVRRGRSRGNGCIAEDGWPWPWDDSRLTDYSYAYERGAVWGSNFGRPWFPVDDLRRRRPAGPPVAFPTMRLRPCDSYAAPRKGGG